MSAKYGFAEIPTTKIGLFVDRVIKRPGKHHGLPGHLYYSEVFALTRQHFLHSFVLIRSEFSLCEFLLDDVQ